MNKTYAFILILAMLIGGAYLYFNPFWEGDKETDGSNAGSIIVTIGVEDVSNLGALYIELLYDATLMEATKMT